MNLVDLIVLVCSVATPSVCREEHLLLQTQGSLDGCMVQAQPYLAQWIGDHPDLQIARWRCAWPESEGKDI
jgi:hypothetical protein